MMKNLLTPIKAVAIEQASKPMASALYPLTHARSMHISYGKKNTSASTNKEKQHHPSCPCCSGNNKVSFSSSSSAASSDKKGSKFENLYTTSCKFHAYIFCKFIFEHCGTITAQMKLTYRNNSCEGPTSNCYITRRSSFIRS